MRRRPWAAGILVTAALAALPSGALAGAIDMSTPRGDTTRSGATDDPALNPPLAQAWATTLGEGTRTPIAAAGRVFVASGPAVVALSAADGHVLWSWARPGRTASSQVQIAYDAGQVYAGDGGTLTALDAATGLPRWGATLSPIGSEYDGAMPVAAGGLVYVTAGASIEYDAPHAVLTAYDAATGALAWATPLPRGPLRGAGAPTLSGGKVYVSLGDGGMGVFDAATGAEIGTPRPGSDPGTQPTAVAVVHGYAWAGSGQVAYALDTGLPMGILDTQSYAPVGSAAGFVRKTANHGVEEGIEISDNYNVGPRWWALLASTADSPEPYIAGKVVYTEDDEGRIIGLSMNNGNRVFCARAWTHGTADNEVVAGSGIVVAVGEGVVRAYRHTDGPGLNCDGERPDIQTMHHPLQWYDDPWWPWPDATRPPEGARNPRGYFNNQDDCSCAYEGGYPLAEHRYWYVRDGAPPPIAESLAAPDNPPAGRAPGQPDYPPYPPMPPAPYEGDGSTPPPTTTAPPPPSTTVPGEGGAATTPAGEGGAARNADAVTPAPSGGVTAPALPPASLAAPSPKAPAAVAAAAAAVRRAAASCTATSGARRTTVVDCAIVSAQRRFGVRLMRGSKLLARGVAVGRGGSARVRFRVRGRLAGGALTLAAGPRRIGVVPRRR